MFFLLCTEAVSWLTITLHPTQGPPGESALPQLPTAITDSGEKQKTTEAQQSQTQQHMVLEIKLTGTEVCPCLQAL